MTCNWWYQCRQWSPSVALFSPALFPFYPSFQYSAPSVVFTITTMHPPLPKMRIQRPYIRGTARVYAVRNGGGSRIEVWDGLVSIMGMAPVAEQGSLRGTPGRIKFD
jgi:hypothetical protein